MGSSKVLLVGGAGSVGRCITLASVKAGHSTFVLVRDPSPTDATKAAVLDSFRTAGVTLLTGDLNDHASVVAAVKQVDIVISVVGWLQTLDQLKLLEVIKEVGGIKRFIPSEFGSHSLRKFACLAAFPIIETRLEVQEAVKKSGVPFTFVICGPRAQTYLERDNIWQGGSAAPRDKFTIYGDGNSKTAIVDMNDVGTYTILAADDPRAENKTLYVRPAGIYLSQNEIVALWEQKIGKKLEKTNIPEEEMVKTIESSPPPVNLFTAVKLMHFVDGFKSDISDGVEASALYPDAKYSTTSEMLDRLL